jgi:hypothetical protein
MATVVTPCTCGPGGAASGIAVTVPRAVCTNAAYGKVVTGAYTYSTPSLPKFTEAGNLLNPGASAAGGCDGDCGGCYGAVFKIQCVPR